MQLSSEQSYGADHAVYSGNLAVALSYGFLWGERADGAAGAKDGESGGAVERTDHVAVAELPQLELAAAGSWTEVFHREQRRFVGVGVRHRRRAAWCAVLVSGRIAEFGSEPGETREQNG